MRFWSGLITLIFFCSNSFAQNNVERAGDITANALPISAVIVPLILQDWKKVKESVKSIAVSTVTVHAIKQLAGKRRPNYDIYSNEFSSGTSFPSGHTQAAFSGASLLHKHYGIYVGLPAYVIAAFTGYSRIYADKHYFDDVIAGASIGVFGTLLFAEDSNVNFWPVVKKNHIGLNVEVKDIDKVRLSAKKISFRLRSFYSQVYSNDLDSMADAVSLSGENNELVTSRARFDIEFSEKYNLSLSFRPTELKGPSFLSGERTAGDFESFAIDLITNKIFYEKNKWSLSFGIGLTYQNYALTVFQRNSDEEFFYFSDSNVFADVKFNARYRLYKNHLLSFEALYGLVRDQSSILNLDISYQMKLQDQWSLSFGVVHESRAYANSSPVEDLSLTGPHIDVIYSY